MPSWEYAIGDLDCVPCSDMSDPEERAVRDNASADYWRSRAVAAERRIVRLEGLLETPENQRDAQSVLDAHEECYQLSLMLDSMSDQIIELSEDSFIWYTAYQDSMKIDQPGFGWPGLPDKVIYT